MSARIECPICEASPCRCERDEGGEYPCTECGTTGWDCLSRINQPNGQHCCGMCPFVQGHKRAEVSA